MVSIRSSVPITPAAGRGTAWTCGALLLVFALGCMPLAQAEPDADQLGRSAGYPVGQAAGSWVQPAYRVGSWSAMDRVSGMPVRAVARAAPVTPLPVAAHAPAIIWRSGGHSYTLDEYLEQQRVTGLLILKNGAIVAERYRYGRDDTARFLSFSMSKSVTSLLVGAALSRGVIASLDDPAEKYAAHRSGICCAWARA